MKIDQLKAGRDFWLWVIEDVDKHYSKHNWPEYHRIEDDSNDCPLCVAYQHTLKDCGICPLVVRKMKCGQDYNNPWDIWNDLSTTHAQRTAAANQILAVYEEEIRELKHGAK